MRTLSASQVDTFLKCPELWRLERTLPKAGGKPSRPLRAGDIFHQLMASFLKNRAQPLDFYLDMYLNTTHDEVEVTRIIKQLVKSFQDDGRVPYMVEVNMDTLLAPDLRLTAIFDEFYQTNDTVWIGETKTMMKPPDDYAIQSKVWHTKQPMAYNVVLQDIFGATHLVTKVVYTIVWPGGMTIRERPLLQEDAEVWRPWLIQIADDMEWGSHIPRDDNASCRFCEFDSTVCDARRKLGIKTVRAMEQSRFKEYNA